MKVDDWLTQVFKDIVQINLANLIQIQVINYDRKYGIPAE